jgi:hypothetical protein
VSAPLSGHDLRTDTSSTTARIGYFDGTAAVGNRTSYTYSSTIGLLFSETNALTKAVRCPWPARERLLSPVRVARVADRVWQS